MKHASPFIALPILICAACLSGCSLLGPVVKTAMPLAGLKLAFSCIPEHTLVDTPAGRQPIEKLEAGEPVIGYSGRPVLILQKHSYLESPRTVFLHITFDDGASIDLCGM